MGVDPVSLGFMATSMALSAASAANQNKAAKAQAGIGDRASKETAAMRDAAQAQSVIDRNTAEAQRADAQKVWEGALPGVTREAQDAAQEAAAAKRYGSYEAATAPSAGDDFMPGSERAPQAAKAETAKQLSEKLAATREMLKARSKIAGVEEGRSAVNRMLGKSGEGVNVGMMLSRGTAGMADKVQQLARQGVANRMDQANRETQYFQAQNPGQSTALDVLGGVSRIGGSAAAAGAFRPGGMFGTGGMISDYFRGPYKEVGGVIGGLGGRA